MKLKLDLLISDPEQFIKGNYEWCFQVGLHPDAFSEWTCAGEFEIDVKADRDALIEKATEKLNERMGKAQKEIEECKRRKSELTALPAPEVTS